MYFVKDIVQLINKILHHLRYKQTQKKYNSTFSLTNVGGIVNQQGFYFNWRVSWLNSDQGVWIYNIFKTNYEFQVARLPLN